MTEQTKEVETIINCPDCGKLIYKSEKCSCKQEKKDQWGQTTEKK